MATGENSGTWGTVTNTNLGTALEEAIVGSADVTFASADQTLTLTDTNATQTARNMRLNLTGTTGGSARNLIVPAIEKVYIVNNGCADAVTVKNSTGTGISVPAGKTMWVYNDATNVVDVITHLTSLTLGSALPIASGGTGSTTATFSGANITSLNASNVSSGTLANARTTASSSNGSSTIVARDASGGTNIANISISANTIASTDTNGNIVLAPNGTGDVQVDADTLRVGDANANATLTTNGTGDLILNTNAGTNSGSITIQDAANGNIIFAPNGTGRIQVSGTTAAPAILELYEDADNGTNYIALSAPSSVASNVTFTLPNADGTSGQVLQTNGSGVLSFATASGISTGKSIAMALIFGF